MNPFKLNFSLDRPLAFIDIESTGANKDTDKIIEIGVCKLFPDGNREIKVRRVNPCIPISPASTEIHGITDEDVKDEPRFAEIAKGLLDYLADCDLAGFSSNYFDIPILFNEFARAGIYWDYKKFKMIDVGNIYKIQEPRTLMAAVAFYTSKVHEGAHSAGADAAATCDVFLAQLEKYEGVLPDNVGDMQLFSNYGKPILDLSGKFSVDEDGDIIFNFGQKRGLKAKNYLDLVDWMYYRADFPADTRAICEQLLFAGRSSHFDKD